MSEPREADLAIALTAYELAADGTFAGAVGVVTDAKAAGTPWEGRRVLVGAVDACGECDVCRRGGAPVCPRGRRRELPQGSLVHAAPRWLVAEGEGLAVPGAAAAAVPGAVALAYTLYARTGVAPREPVVVCGADAVTRFLVEVLLAKGIAPVVVADPSAAAWCAWLAGRGAAVAQVPVAAPDAEARTAVAAALGALAQDPTAARAGGRPWRVLAAGDLPRAVALAGPRATLTVRAAGAAPAELLAALAREVTVIGVAGPHPELVLEAAALAVRGELDLAAGVTVRTPGAARAPDATHADVVDLS